MRKLYEIFYPNLINNYYNILHYENLSFYENDQSF